ncbi:MAG: hypothetical protein HWQ38_01810 [Nostoc sp. NMS7]|uniref:hypothetical protein n=1 Tax=Nostoc sp. NMS7 TaxID=2815391 RepID=UPI0025F183CC|nr:hypothetical protein [Nostoc sp. NMS7]MBN3945277.1 hypothetical protein [Nostoc sp. NMS7]
MDELKAKIREYSHLAASLSSQARSIPIEPKENRKRKLDLMRQARDASLQCQALIQELKKQVA